LGDGDETTASDEHQAHALGRARRLLLCRSDHVDRGSPRHCRGHEAVAQALARPVAPGAGSDGDARRRLHYVVGRYAEQLVMLRGFLQCLRDWPPMSNVVLRPEAFAGART
jgi:hypothetical protein